MKIFYNGREIPQEYAKLLEDNGQAHFGNFVSRQVAEGTEEAIIMESGPSNNWLEKQDPRMFLTHVFGHTSTWAEMARKWVADGESGMDGVATALTELNSRITTALRHRRTHALT